MISDVVHREGQFFEPLQRSLRNMRLNDARELAERAAIVGFTTGVEQSNPFNTNEEEQKLHAVWAASYQYMLAYLAPDLEGQ